MTRLYTIVTLLVLGCCVSTAYAECNATDEISVQIGSGWLCGKRRAAENNVTYASFRGVQYAEHPLGKLRFAELQEKVPWDGYYNASEEGAMCPQDDVVYGNLVNTNRTISEECIFANVHVPLVNSTADLSSQSGLPILVYIYGGGFEAGSGNSDLFGPEFLVSKGVIVITFNFRVNVFGYFSLNTTKVPGNAGLRDAVTLLKWVQTNAAAFGGNASNVTLMGQSAGAATAHLLSLSKATEGLFSRIILMSGSAWPSFYSTSPSFAEYVKGLFLTQLGINSTDPDYIFETLTEMSLDTIMAANSVIQNVTVISCFDPVIEWELENVTMILDADPLTLMKQGRGKDIPIMMGFTDQEALAFYGRVVALDVVGAVQNDSLASLPQRILYDLPENVTTPLATEMLARYFADVSNLTLKEYFPLISDTYFKSTQFNAAKLRAQTGGADVFFYNFVYTAEDQLVKEPLGLNNYTGAVHVEDLTYILRPNLIIGDHVSFPPTSQDDYMRDWMSDFVANFTRCSDPTCSGGTLWKPISNETLYYQLIAAPNVYNNTEPTQEQLDMMAFHQKLEDTREAALSASL